MITVEVNQEVFVDATVSIGIEEITAALHEHLDSVSETDCERTKKRRISMFVSSIHQCLCALPDDAIGELDDETRRLIVGGFEKQINRFRGK